MLITRKHNNETISLGDLESGDVFTIIKVPEDMFYDFGEDGIYMKVENDDYREYFIDLQCAMIWYYEDGFESIEVKKLNAELIIY